MLVDVVLYSGAGHPADVPAEVEAVRRVLGPQRGDTAGGEPVHLGGLVCVQRSEVADVAVRRDEQVPRGVRELVHDDERPLAAVDEELLLGLTEDAPVELVRVLHVLEAPRRPQRLRHQTRA